MTEFATLDFMAEVIDALGLQGRSITQLQITLNWNEGPYVTVDITERLHAESVGQIAPVLRRYRSDGGLVGKLRLVEEATDHE